MVNFSRWGGEMIEVQLTSNEVGKATQFNRNMWNRVEKGPSQFIPNHFVPRFRQQ